MHFKRFLMNLWKPTYSCKLSHTDKLDIFNLSKWAHQQLCYSCDLMESVPLLPSVGGEELFQLLWNSISSITAMRSPDIQIYRSGFRILAGFVLISFFSLQRNKVMSFRQFLWYCWLIRHLLQPFITSGSRGLFYSACSSIQPVLDLL